MAAKSAGTTMPVTYFALVKQFPLNRIRDAGQRDAAFAVIDGLLRREHSPPRRPFSCLRSDSGRRPVWRDRPGECPGPVRQASRWPLASGGRQLPGDYASPRRCWGTWRPGFLANSVEQSAKLQWARERRATTTILRCSTDEGRFSSCIDDT